MNDTKQSQEETKGWGKVISRIFYNFLLIWGSLGLIFLAVSIAGVDTEGLFLSIGGFFTKLLGSWFATIWATLVISLSYWWLWLLLGYLTRRAQK